jgi:hypothetical protein
MDENNEKPLSSAKAMEMEALLFDMEDSELSPSSKLSLWMRMVRLLGDREAHLLTVLEAVSRATSLAEAQKFVCDELNSYAGDPVAPPGPRMIWNRDSAKKVDE